MQQFDVYVTFRVTATDTWAAEQKIADNLKALHMLIGCERVELWVGESEEVG